MGWFKKFFQPVKLPGGGYQPVGDTLDTSNPPQGGTGLVPLYKVEPPIPWPAPLSEEVSPNVESDPQSAIQGLRHDQDKVRYDLISPIALHYLALVWTMGATKYADRNWEKGLSFCSCFGCAMRHAWKWFRGQELDEESGLPHLAHAAWNLLVIMHLSFTKPGCDDRVKLLDIPFPDRWETPDLNV